VPDYSEFPTTPTGWQERAWQEVAPPPAEYPTPEPPRRFDPVALVFGIVFAGLAVVLMTGVTIPSLVFNHGGILWALLIAGGVVLLAGELRKARHK
jgi:hypothetical protein